MKFVYEVLHSSSDSTQDFNESIEALLACIEPLLLSLQLLLVLLQHLFIPKTHKERLDA